MINTQEQVSEIFKGLKQGEYLKVRIGIATTALLLILK